MNRVGCLEVQCSSRIGEAVKGRENSVQKKGGEGVDHRSPMVVKSDRVGGN